MATKCEHDKKLSARDTIRKGIWLLADSIVAIESPAVNSPVRPPSHHKWMLLLM